MRDFKGLFILLGFMTVGWTASVATGFATGAINRIGDSGAGGGVFAIIGILVGGIAGIFVIANLSFD